MGGGGKGSSPPPPPDPAETGQAQTATNVSTAIANAWLRNPTQITPFGDLRFVEQGQYVWFDPLDQNPGRVEAERAYNQWLEQNPAPQLPDPSLRATDPQAYEQQLQAYDEWMRERNSVIRDLATQHQTNIYSIPLLTAYQALSPEQQTIWHNVEQAYQQLSGMAADQAQWLRDYLNEHQVDLSGIPEREFRDFSVPELQGAPEAPDYAHLFDGDQAPDWSAQRQRIEEALMGRLEPVLQRDENRLIARLAAQGLQPGTEAWRQAMDDYNRRVNDARLAAILGAGRELERDIRTQIAQVQAENAIRSAGFGDELRAAAFDNQAAQQAFADEVRAMQAEEQQRNAALSEAFALRNQPIQEIMGILHGTPIQQPRFVNANVDSIPTVDYAGIVNENYRQRLAAWQAEQQAAAAMWGSVLGFMGSLFGALSDPRAKKDVKKANVKFGDVPAVTYRYKDEPPTAPKRIGVLASQVEKKAPEAVIETPIRKPGQRKGLRFVDYDALTEQRRKKKRRRRNGH